jgi:hypothetical protein
MLRNGSRGLAGLSEIRADGKSTFSPGWQAILIWKPAENAGFRSSFAAKFQPAIFGSNRTGILEFAGFHDSEIKC